MVRLVSLVDKHRAFCDRFARLVKFTSAQFTAFYVSGDDADVATRYFRVYEEPRNFSNPVISVDLEDNKITIREKKFYDMALDLAQKYERLEPGIEFILETP